MEWAKGRTSGERITGVFRLFLFLSRSDVMSDQQLPVRASDLLSVRQMRPTCNTRKRPTEACSKTRFVGGSRSTWKMPHTFGRFSKSIRGPQHS
ncbi:esterase [Anopheles sinensis]|uniref:Esterase n=1 Tax=Anopheles sinensis TaxID=74873 RepID=A0A084WFA4_ANOSI|nr:esterase [Anopheles sinensis]